MTIREVYVVQLPRSHLEKTSSGSNSPELEHWCDLKSDTNKRYTHICAMHHFN